MSIDYTQLKAVPRPEDDDPAKVREAISILERTRQADIMQIASEQGYDLFGQNTALRVMAFCHGQNDYQWFLLNLGRDFGQERLEECIEQMRSLRKRDPNELHKTQLLSHDLGIEYRKVRLSLGL